MADTSSTDSQVGLSTIENFDLHDPRTLMFFADRYVKPKSFLKDFFFPTGAGDTFATESVLLDSITRGRKAAPFVVSGSKVMDRDNFTTDEYKPPRIAPARRMTVDDLLRRGFGEQLFNGDKPNVRASRMTVQDMNDLSDMITRREEIMCSEVLRTNACVMKHIDAAGGADTNTHTIKFYAGSTNNQVYTPAKTWSDASANIIGDIKAMRDFVRKYGNKGDVLLVSPDVAEAIVRNTEILKLLDNKRVEIGGVAPEEIPDGATKICVLNAFGANVTVISYDETYENDEGTDTPYLPAGTAILASKACGRGIYGGVAQLEHATNDFKFYEGRRIPKIIKDVNNDEKKLQLVARPIMAPAAKCAWIAAKAIFA